MIELLCPAGGMPQLHAALHFGANAVYGGMKSYGLRAFAGNFDDGELLQAIAFAHAKNAKFYVTLNILPFDEELDGFVDAARRAHAAGADAAIVSDLGAALMLREKVPQLPLHISTQANTVNSAAAAFWHGIGAQRVVLARELSLAKIAQLRQHTPPDLELEAFVHGAMCMAYSGRCMLSDAMTGRGANHGACAQPCRWEYAVTEKKRPNEQWPVYEDERGTFIFSAYDLNMLSHLPELIAAGITSFKIEGRMKTEYYVATVTRAYRRALDLLQTSEDAYRAELPQLEAELLKASHRAFNTGFYFGAPTPPSGAAGFTQSMEYTARVEGMQDGCARLAVRNRFYAGDTLEAVTPRGSIPFEVKKIILCEAAQDVDTVYIAGTHVLVPVDFPLEAGDLIRGINRNHAG